MAKFQELQKEVKKYLPKTDNNEGIPQKNRDRCLSCVHSPVNAAVVNSEGLSGLA